MSGGVQSIYLIAGDNGDVLLEKHYKGIVNRSAVETFWEEVSKRSKRDDVPPILLSTRFYLCSIYRDDVYVLALMTGEMPVLLVLEFLHRVFDVLKGYFGGVTRKSITDNFSVTFQLLEEMLDNGYPMVTEPNALNSLIAPPSMLLSLAKTFTGKSSVSDTLGDGAMSVIPWRRSGVVYAANEIFFDIMEEIDCIVESNGTVVANDVRGVITANCRMSGTPDLTLLFANPALIEDCSFHPCVRYARFENERVVSFVPPDGNFQLMTYRVVDRVPNMPVYCRPTITWREGSARASFLLATKPQGRKAGGGAGGVAVRNSTGGISGGGGAAASSGGGGGGEGGLPIEDVVLKVVFPACVRSVDLTSDVGTVTIDPSTNAITWVVGRYPHGKQPELVGTLHLAPGSHSPPLESPNATMHFRVEGSTVSNLGVKDLLLTGEKYKFFKALKMGTKSGRFQVRC